mmetsp:Transcript_4408/g.12648  ORF Transcript_4408/g.12648 Transcript_4408/m.12648 type:complete len:211 (-) Transcript_4408:219-851(-)
MVRDDIFCILHGLRSLLARQPWIQHGHLGIPEQRLPVFRILSQHLLRGLPSFLVLPRAHVHGHDVIHTIQHELSRFRTLRVIRFDARKVRPVQQFGQFLGDLFVQSDGTFALMPKFVLVQVVGNLLSRLVLLDGEVRIQTRRVHDNLLDLDGVHHARIGGQFVLLEFACPLLHGVLRLRPDLNDLAHAAVWQTVPNGIDHHIALIGTDDP